MEEGKDPDWYPEETKNRRKIQVYGMDNESKKIELKPKSGLCQSCELFYNCETAKGIERNGKIQTNCNFYKDISELPYKSLKDVYDVFLKWFPTLDTTRIDTRFAWFISNEFGLGGSLWIFEVSRSGLAKSTLSESMSECHKVIEIGQLSPKALISGKTIKLGKKEVPVQDFGMRLHRRNRCVIIAESAYLKAMHQGEKRELFACLKQLHDGKLKKESGSGVVKNYKDCNTSMWFNSTPDFHKEAIIHQEIGTCYLVDCIDLKIEGDDSATEKAIEDRNKSKQIREETTYVVKCFLAHHHLKNINFDKEVINFLKREANRLKWIRATGSYDRNDELKYIPQPEFPARVAKQLSKLYQSLLSLDNEYDKGRARKIVKRVVDGSADSVMVKVLEFIDGFWSLKQANLEDSKFTVTSVVDGTGLGTQTVKRRLELLRGLGFLKRSNKKSGQQGGRPGNEYFFNDDIDDDRWQSLFRHPIVRKEDIRENT